MLRAARKNLLLRVLKRYFCGILQKHTYVGANIFSWRHFSETFLACPGRATTVGGRYVGRVHFDFSSTLVRL